MTVNIHKIRKLNIFYGYWILLIAFLCLFISLGLASYPWSLFVKPIESDLGWSRGAIMTGSTVFNITMAAASLFIGRLVDTKWVSYVIAAGAGIAGIGFVLLSSMQSIYSFYLGYFIIGLGMTASGQIPAAAVVANWFHKRRGLAIGVMFAGAGSGGIIFVPFIGGFLIPSLGWRMSYFAMAFIPWIILIPLALFVLKTKPSDMGLFPDGANTSESQKKHINVQPVHDFTTKVVLANSAFWLIAVSYLFAGFSQNGFFFNLVPYFQETGLSILSASTLVGFISIGSVIGKIGFGLLCDYVHPRYTVSICLFLEITSILLLTLTINETTPMILLIVYALIFGLGAGGILPTLPLMIGKYFGLRSYGTLLGIINFGFYVGSGIGPMMAGYAYDMMGTYYQIFIVFVGLIVITLLIMLAMRSSIKTK